jgi:protein-tyrosine phosphatase
VSAHGPEQGARFRVVFVCTGNICRSPFAEILTRHLLIGRLGGRVAESYDLSSVGVRAVAGARMHPDTREQLVPWGLYERAGRFVARQLTSDVLCDADLVLGATPRHRSAAVEKEPGVLSRSFSLREFARLVTAVNPAELPPLPPDRGPALVELARRQRGMLPTPPDDDDIPDPMGRLPEAHGVAAGLIREAAQRIVDVLAPAGPTVRPLSPDWGSQRPGR